MLKQKITIPVLYEVQKSLVSLTITLTDIYYNVNLMVILNRSANYALMPISLVSFTNYKNSDRHLL